LQANHYAEYAKLASYLRQEGGLVIGTFYSDKHNTAFFNFNQFFTGSPIELVLSAITLVWRYLKANHQQPVTRQDRSIGYIYPKASAWRDFVNRSLREENVGYVADAECGIHFFVDEEFERNRAYPAPGMPPCVQLLSNRTFILTRARQTRRQLLDLLLRA
jgi:hypothetical protein